MASIILLYSTNSINLVIKPQEYKEDIQGSFMNIGFIFIECYENKYFTHGSSHRKKLEYSVYYKVISFLTLWIGRTPF
jgi:hypothetical protein